MNNKTENNLEITINQQPKDEIKADNISKDAVRMARLRQELAKRSKEGHFFRIDRNNF